MAEKLGALEYDLRISEEKLDKTIADIEKKLENFNKKAEKLLTIDTKRTKSLSEEQKQLRMINVTTTQRLVNAEKVAVAEARTTAATRKNANLSVDAANKQLMVEEKLRLAKNQTAASQLRLVNAQKKSLTAVNRVNTAYKKQGMYLQNLKTMAGTYLSVFAALNLSKQIAKITGEFELQRKALAAIIQSKDEADKLFTRVTEVALKSPFNIKNLLSYTKMLAAYRIESSELISTLGKLGDVSAGLGVDMSRLILAFGQVKAASVLRGQEVRQFTEAGIPIIALLADKLSDLEGVAVSTNEVFTKISKRMISFGMVSEIFDEMTARGGIFFEAQLVQAKTLAGMMSIFQDALDKAMSAIGDKDINILKGTVELATSLVDSWRAVLATLWVIIRAYGAYRVALLFLNKQRAVGNVLVKAGTMNVNQLTFAQKRQIVTLRASAGAWSTLGLSIKKAGIFMKSNALLLGITAIAAVGLALYRAAKEANRLRNELDDIATSGFVKSQDLVENFNRLAKAAVGATDGSHNQREAVDELKRTYKEYLPLQEMNIQNLKDLKGNYESLTKAIYNKARARAFEKGQEKITAELQKETGKATDFLIAGLVDVDVAKKDAVNIVKIFRDELIKSGGDAGKVLQKVARSYLGETVSLKTKGLTTDLNSLLTGFNEIARGAYGYGAILLKTTQAQDNFKASMEAAYDSVSAVLIGERIAMEEITSTYEKAEMKLKGMTLSKKEYADKSVELTKRELQARIDYYKTIEEGENKIYATGRITQYTKQLEALNKEGGAYQKLISKIIKEARGEDEKIGIKLEVLESEDTAIHMKRIVAEYKDYKKLIEQTEGVVKAYRKTQQEGWQRAVKVSESELKTLKANLLVTKAIADALGLALGTKKDEKEEEIKLLNNLRIRLKFYKEIKRVNEDLRKTLGIKKTKLTIDELFGKQAEDLKIEIPVDLKSEELIAKMEDLVDRAEKIGKGVGKKWADAVRIEIAKLKAEDLIKETKKALKEIDEEIALYKAKHKLFEEILGLTGDEKLAIKLAFDGSAAKKDLEKTLKSMVEEKAIVMDIELDYEALKAQIDSLPEELRKSILSIEKLISTSVDNTLIRRLKFIRVDIPEGIGLEFNFDKIISDLNTKIGKLKAEMVAITKGATELEKQEINAVFKLKSAAINEEARQRIEKMGDAYIKEQMAVNHLGDAYANMTNASLDDINKIIAVINKASADLFRGENLKGFFEGADVDFSQYKGVFDDIFDSKDIEDFNLKIIDLKSELSGLKAGDKLGGIEVDESDVVKLRNLITLLETFGIASENAARTVTLFKIKKQAAEWKKLTGEINELIGVVEDLGSAFGMSVGGKAMEALRAIQAASVGIITLIEKTAILATGAVKGIEKASVILAVVGAALQIIQGLQRFSDSIRDEQEALAENSKRVSERLDIEYEINQIHKERIALQEKSAFLVQDFGKGMKDALAIIKEETVNLKETMDAIYTEGLLTGEGSARNLWGKRTREFSASMEDLVAGVEDPDISLWDKFELIFDITGSKRSKRAMKRAVRDLREGFDDALTTMGKTASDVAQFSTQEWLDFYTILEKQGHITDEGTKAMVELARKQYEALLAAKEQMREIISSIAGDLGAQIGDVLVDSFARGIDAAEGFRKAVEDVMMNIIKQKIIQKYFGDLFSQLEDDMEKSFDIAGDEDWLDDLDRFFKASEDSMFGANEALRKIEEWGKERGYDFFGMDKDLSALTKGIQGLSEDTGRRLEALFNSNREINIQDSAKLNIIIENMGASNRINSQILGTLQTMNNNLVGYIKTFNSIVKQGSDGSGIRTYVN
jgi:hypothetical protein